MCSIHLILDKQQQLSSDQPLACMMRESAYRGPDANGTLRIDQPSHTLWFGSSRLQVSDPHKRADQPFVSPDSRYILLYNGELYNHYELRNQLLSEGVSFVTQSDTEVLLHWLIHRGGTDLDELNGMFAFLFYDRQEDTLWAARDRFGMKPLYYAETEAYLILSSEAKSITAAGLIAKITAPVRRSSLPVLSVSPPGTDVLFPGTRTTRGTTMVGYPPASPPDCPVLYPPDRRRYPTVPWVGRPAH